MRGQMEVSNIVNVELKYMMPTWEVAEPLLTGSRSMESFLEGVFFPKLLPTMPNTSQLIWVAPDPRLQFY